MLFCLFFNFGTGIHQSRPNIVLFMFFLFFSFIFFKNVLVLLFISFRAYSVVYFMISLPFSATLFIIINCKFFIFYLPLFVKNNLYCIIQKDHDKLVAFLHFCDALASLLVVALLRSADSGISVMEISLAYFRNTRFASP